MNGQVNVSNDELGITNAELGDGCGGGRSLSIIIIFK
tara:strand:- start:2755 stop:2865 length:111 start_codon:yes stop_codon:yes gene_type:complete